MTKNIFIVIGILLTIWFFIHLYLWNKCRKNNGIQPTCVKNPCPFIYADCNFITLISKKNN